jgi:hypothetical protein
MDCVDAFSADFAIAHADQLLVPSRLVDDGSQRSFARMFSAWAAV